MLRAPAARAALAMLAFSGWLVALFTGGMGGGAAHLLLAVALIAFPWKTLRA